MPRAGTDAHPTVGFDGPTVNPCPSVDAHQPVRERLFAYSRVCDI